MSNCNYTTLIDENACLGDSLSILNANFSNLDTAACSLSSLENIIITNLTTYSNSFNNNIFALINLINSNVSSPTTITALATPLTVFSKSPEDINGDWQCLQGYNTTYNNSFNLASYSIPSTASFILLRSDDTSYQGSGGYPRTVTVNGIQVYMSQSPITGLTTPYTTIPKTLVNNVVYTYNASSPHCVSPTDWKTKTNLRIIGYY